MRETFLLSIFVMAASFPSLSQPEHRLDHVILGVSDLEEGIRQLEELTGVRAEFGGEHPSLGTHNALLSLGGHTYLEILAPRPGAEVIDWLQFLEDIPEIKPVMWAIASDSIQKTRDLLTAAGFETNAPVAGSRERSDGSTLRWQMMSFKEPAFATSFFVLDWDDASIHPSASSPQGCRLESFALADPEARKLQGLLEAVGLNIPVTPTSSRSLNVSLTCSKGRVTL